LTSSINISTKLHIEVVYNNYAATRGNNDISRCLFLCMSACLSVCTVLVVSHERTIAKSSFYWSFIRQVYPTVPCKGHWIKHWGHHTSQI